MALAALGYIMESFGDFLIPGHEGLLAGIVAVTAVAGELTLCLWLLVKGVDVERWHERAGA